MHCYGLRQDQNVFCTDEKQLYFSIACLCKKNNLRIYPKDPKSLEKAEGHLISLCETHSSHPREIKPPVTKWEERTPGGEDRDTWEGNLKRVLICFIPYQLTQEAVFLKACVCHFEMHRAINMRFISTYWFQVSIPETVWQIKSAGAKTKWFIAEIFNELLWARLYLDSEGKTNKTSIVFKGYTCLQYLHSKEAEERPRETQKAEKRKFKSRWMVKMHPHLS